MSTFRHEQSTRAAAAAAMTYELGSLWLRLVGRSETVGGQMVSASILPPEVTDDVIPVRAVDHPDYDFSFATVDTHPVFKALPAQVVHRSLPREKGAFQEYLDAVHYWNTRLVSTADGTLYVRTDEEVQTAELQPRPFLKNERVWQWAPSNRGGEMPKAQDQRYFVFSEIDSCAEWFDDNGECILVKRNPSNERDTYQALQIIQKLILTGLQHWLSDIEERPLPKATANELRDIGQTMRELFILASQSWETLSDEVPVNLQITQAGPESKDFLVHLDIKVPLIEKECLGWETEKLVLPLSTFETWFGSVSRAAGVGGNELAGLLQLFRTFKDKWSKLRPLTKDRARLFVGGSKNLNTHFRAFLSKYPEVQSSLQQRLTADRSELRSSDVVRSGLSWEMMAWLSWQDVPEVPYYQKLTSEPVSINDALVSWNEKTGFTDPAILLSIIKLFETWFVAADTLHP